MPAKHYADWIESITLMNLYLTRYVELKVTWFSFASSATACQFVRRMQAPSSTAILHQRLVNQCLYNKGMKLVLHE